MSNSAWRENNHPFVHPGCGYTWKSEFCDKSIYMLSIGCQWYYASKSKYWEYPKVDSKEQVYKYLIIQY